MAKREMFARGLTVGAVAGLTAGLLFAPRTGRESRRTLQKSVRALPELGMDLASSLQRLGADRVALLAQQQWEATLARLQQSVAAGLVAARQELQGTEGATATATKGISPATGTRSPARRS